ncbi:MAG: hypothetical protein M1269_04955 [Chloroflexi bacterium]|nr:hypothetical protein [Chloroflexota bacterium]
MAVAYAPGLKVTEETIIHAERRLPLAGEVMVKPGDKVSHDTVVARTFLPGDVKPIGAAGQLGVEPSELPNIMIKKEGDQVKEGEVIGESKGLFGLFTSRIISPADGKIELISNVTGQVIVREPPVPIEITAYVDGIVENIIPHEGVTVKTFATFIQGIFGIGGETNGVLEMVVNDPAEELKKELLKKEHEGKILVGGSLVTMETLEEAVRLGVKGIIVGGIGDQDLKNFLGYDLGVAITGSEEKGITLIITEGFGKMAMARKTFDLLNLRRGNMASMNGATQIRAGVMRPEIIIPIRDKEWVEHKEIESYKGMVVGSTLRIIREPYFGLLVKVTSLPVELTPLETEAKVRIVEVELQDGRKIILPRANVEIIES